MSLGNLQRFAGFELCANPILTKAKEVHRRERKWAHRVMYRREQRFVVRIEQVPSDEIIRVGSRLFMHPQTLERVNQALSARQAASAQWVV